MYERAKREPDCDAARDDLETPVATLDRGGAPPDFVSVGTSTKADVDVCHVVFKPHAFHILDAIEHRVARAGSNDDLKRILARYVDRPRPQISPEFVMMPQFDPGAVERLRVYAAAVKLKAAADPRFNPANDPALAVPEDLPPDAQQRGCRVTAGRGFLDPRFERPPFDNWTAATFCQIATGSQFEYRVAAPSGNYAIYDGKRGSVVYECKCGYSAIAADINSDNPRSKSRAESRLLAILRQKENHASVASQCGLSLTYKVSDPGLTQILRTAWSDVSVDEVHVPGYAESCGP